QQQTPTLGQARVERLPHAEIAGKALWMAGEIGKDESDTVQSRHDFSLEPPAALFAQMLEVLADNFRLIYGAHRRVEDGKRIVIVSLVWREGRHAGDGMAKIERNMATRRPFANPSRQAVPLLSHSARTDTRNFHRPMADQMQ